MAGLSGTTLLLAATLLSPGSPAYSADSPNFAYGDFANAAGLTMNGTASISGSALRLSDLGTDRSAATWHNTPIDPGASFESTFRVSLHDGSAPPADGVALVIQSSAAGTAALGRFGEGIGYGGITPSVEVEFDTWLNSWDPDANHIAVTTGGDETTSVALADPSFPLYGTPFTAWVDYDAAAHRIAVYASQTATKPATPVVSTGIDLAGTLGTGAPAYIGLTGGTGSNGEDADILSWSYGPASTTSGSAGRRYVALGDSFASGEGADEGQFGNTTFPDPKVPGSTTGCHRSSKSWANVVAEKLVGPTVGSWKFVACSGAVADDLYGPNDTYKGVSGVTEPAQMSFVDRNTYRATLSIGGNDANYSKIIKACVIDYVNNQLDRDCRQKGSTGYKLAEQGTARLRDGLPVPSVAPGATKPLAQVYFDIANRMAPGGQLVVAGYPSLFATSRLSYRTKGFKCLVGTGLGAIKAYVSYDDAQWLNQLAGVANSYIRTSVADANSALRRARSTVIIDYADVSPQFTDHRLCSGSRWFNGAELTFKVPPRPKQVSFHPNSQGQAAYAKAVMTRVRS